MNIKNVILFLLQLFFINVCSYANDSHRAVIVNTDSSYIITSISTKKLDNSIKLRDDLVYLWYRRNHIFSTYGNYGGSLLDGDYCEYDLNGRLISKGVFLLGLRHGKWYFWCQNNGLLRIIHYRNGRKNGKCVHYNNKGMPFFIVNYRDGLKNGYEIKISNGLVIYKRKYIKGVLKYEIDYLEGKFYKKVRYLRGNKIIKNKTLLNRPFFERNNKALRKSKNEEKEHYSFLGKLFKHLKE